ncbi:murein biosynthesis integral membrane protein MurJ [Thalassotalea ponticola]|uniref:murein biosynthesis integral membrane protein MurJ n=1 Tax=Thalassotalea ponticola TaxID=1523392 RepID=UPI0025B397AE|nr:murein biosynthesis integral membrane protein MurJ [Thalassotalea ponticola]MDN3651712.1 murein biosynthesis integral membrane protein MurJ [Thalassotalea ponticola]
MAKRLLKSGLVVSFMTLLSRVLGLVRDVVIADKIGTSAGADVFFFANKIPNFLRRLFAEGAFAQAFVPVLSEYQHLDDENNSQTSRQLIAKVSGTLGVIVTLVTAFGMIASPLMVALFGFGWFLDWLNDGANAAKFDLASSLLVITFPYLWFISLTALAGSILNTLGKFSAAAFTPVLLNVCIILAAIYGSDLFEQPAYALAWGVFFGGLSQFLFQLPFLYKAGVLVKPQWGWRDRGVQKIRKLIIPALFGVSVTQINLLLDTLIASFLITGSISWLYYADRLLEFPLGLFGIAIATIILPSLSRLHAGQNKAQFAATLGWALKVVSLLGWPAMAGLIVLAQPVIMVLFMRGEFSQHDVQQVSYALFAYMSGLVSFMFIKILAPGYYARQDTTTPVKIGIIAMVVNMVFNLILAPLFGYVGLAIATAISATVNATLLYIGLVKANIYRLDKHTFIVMAKLVASALAMALLLYWLSPSFNQWLTFSLFEKVSRLAILIGVGAMSYFALALLLGVRVKHFTDKV